MNRKPRSDYQFVVFYLLHLEEKFYCGGSNPIGGI